MVIPVAEFIIFLCSSCTPVSSCHLTSLINHVQMESKAVPLHDMEALGGTEGIAPTHSRPRH
jgi:hypothetical protein